MTWIILGVVMWIAGACATAWEMGYIYKIEERSANRVEAFWIVFFGWWFFCWAVPIGCLFGWVTEKLDLENRDLNFIVRIHDHGARTAQRRERE